MISKRVRLGGVEGGGRGFVCVVQGRRVGGGRDGGGQGSPGGVRAGGGPGRTWLVGGDLAGGLLGGGDEEAVRVTGR